MACRAQSAVEYGDSPVSPGETGLSTRFSAGNALSATYLRREAGTSKRGPNFFASSSARATKASWPPG